MVGVLPGTMIFGISSTFCSRVSFHACLATSRRTLYLRCCIFVSNFLNFRTILSEKNQNFAMMFLSKNSSTSSGFTEWLSSSTRTETPFPHLPIQNMLASSTFSASPFPFTMWTVNQSSRKHWKEYFLWVTSF